MSGSIPTLSTLITFDGLNGMNPTGNAVFGSDRSLYFTGTYLYYIPNPAGYGTGVGFLHAYSVGGGAYASSVALTFPNAYAHSEFGVTTDPAGNVYGTGTVTVVSGGNEVVAAIAGPQSGTTLASVSISQSPSSGVWSNLSVDAAGNMFLTDRAGGTSSLGAVLEITPSGTVTTVASFNGTNGKFMNPVLIADANGNLFGSTAQGGGTGAFGTVFEITNTAGVLASTPTVLATFTLATGAIPQGGLTIDSDGNLYGFTSLGTPGVSIFEIVKTGGVYASTPITLVSNLASAHLNLSLTVDAAGNLFGTTSAGGLYGYGTVFEVVKGSGAMTTLVNFDGANTGSTPLAGVTPDAAGNLFGTTNVGGASNYGTVFEVTNSGYVVPLCFLRGTRILTPTGEVTVETIAVGEWLVTRFNGFRQVKWIGRQTFDPQAGQDIRDIAPVRISAGALGENLPARDLLVSPGHSVLVDGSLLLAKLLVNGVTITQTRQFAAEAEAIAYYQIEFETHDCVAAEGAWAESFADGPGLRDAYDNVAEFYALYPGYRPPEDISLCAPRPEKGAKLEAALRPLVARAAAGLRPGKLRGAIDLVQAPWRVEGWACDEANPELPVLLEALLDGRVIGSLLACAYRHDLAEAGLGSGHCAFFWTAPVTLPEDAATRLHFRRISDGAALPGSAELPDWDAVTLGLRLVA